MTKFAFRRPNPTMKMKIRLMSESNAKLVLISNVGQTVVENENQEPTSVRSDVNPTLIPNQNATPKIIP